MAVRILKDQLFEGNKHFIVAAGKSTDTKPTSNLVTGSVFVEADTWDMYMFDEEADAGSEWAKAQ